MESAWPTLFRIALGITRNRATAEDATQEACALILQSIRSLRRPSSFNTWAARILIREARRAMRQEPLQPEPAALDDPQEKQADSIDIARALSRLPVGEREVIVLRYFADFNSKEIAAALGVPRGTIRFRLFLARRRLRSLLVAGERNEYVPSSQEPSHDSL